MAKFLILIGVFLVVTGLFRKLRLGNLPGDILIQRKRFRLYLPLSSSLLVGLALIILIWLFRH